MRTWWPIYISIYIQSSLFIMQKKIHTKKASNKEKKNTKPSQLVPILTARQVGTEDKTHKHKKKTPNQVNWCLSLTARQGGTKDKTHKTQSEGNKLN